MFVGEVRNDGPEAIRLVTHTGVVGGTLKPNTKSVLSGKQGRTTLQQAEFMLESEYNEKLDEGYKDFDTVASYFSSMFPTFDFSSPSFYNLNTGDKFLFMLKKLGYTYNTSSNWTPLPMLAEKFKDVAKKLVFPMFVQPKLNGVRCISLWSITHNKVLLCSRGGQYYDIPHISNALGELCRNGWVFDGEIYSHGVPLQKISGDARRGSFIEKQSYLEYHVYDLAMPKMTQAARLETLHNLDDRFVFPVKSVKTLRVASKEEAKKAHDTFVVEGYEGAILRNPEGEYQFGFRDAVLVKMKEFIDEEFEIIGSEVDASGAINTFVFILKNNKDDKTFKARATGTQEYWDIWKQNTHKLIGKKATVRYQERTVDGLPHQAGVRSELTTPLVEIIRDYE